MFWCEGAGWVCGVVYTLLLVLVRRETVHALFVGTIYDVCTSIAMIFECLGHDTSRSGFYESSPVQSYKQRPGDRPVMVSLLDSHRIVHLAKTARCSVCRRGIAVAPPRIDVQKQHTRQPRCSVNLGVSDLVSDLEAGNNNIDEASMDVIEVASPLANQAMACVSITLT